MKVIYNITQNKFNAILNQETTEIKVKFQTGYYPLPGGGGGDLSNYYTKDETYSKTEVDDIIADIPVVDTSNLVPYTGANKDVNIASNYFKTSKGFDFTKDLENYFRTFDNSDFIFFDFTSKDNGIDNFGITKLQIGPEEGFIFYKQNDTSSNLFNVTNGSTYSQKRFITEEGYQILNGTSSQYLMADGSVSTLTNPITGTGTTNYIPKFSASGTIGKSVIYDDNSDVGIGTTNINLKQTGRRVLDINGSTQSLLSFSGNGVNLGYIWAKSDNFQMVSSTIIAFTVGSERMRITNDGNIGISTISPTEKLEIVGYAKATGFKTPTGTATQALTANGGVYDLNTKADLVSGKIPANQLPSYVDDVLEFANLASFPATGESGKIYIAIDTNLTYRWGGSSYVVMSSSLALGETSSTAYRGDRGKIAYDHSQTTGNPHNTKVEELTDVGNETLSIEDTDIILKKEAVGGLWRKITFANFKNWFTNELAKKINIGLDTVFNFKNISAMALTDFRSITPDIETIYFTEEQNGTGWQQVRYNGLGITIPATTETLISLTNENFIELDSDSTFNLIDVANTKINGIFEKDFVIIKFNAGVVTPATANQWFKVILKVNNVQTAVSPVFYLTETSGTVEQIAYDFSLNVTPEMVTNGATLHLKTSAAMTFNNPAISVVRVHKSSNANL